MTVTTDPTIADLIARVTRLEALVQSRRRAPSPEETETEALLLTEAVTADGPMPAARAGAAYSPRAVRLAVQRGWLHRHAGMITAEPPGDAVLRRIGELLADGPVPMSILRTLPGVNKNTIGGVVERAVHEGLLARGVLQTGRAGRPTTIIARADQPLPLHWDTYKVDWSRTTPQS